MITETETLRDELARLGLVAHAHVGGSPAGTCAADGLCLSEKDQATTLVITPDRDRQVYVDPMTAYGILSALVPPAALDQVWEELVDIDHGE